jgi:signal transduction histidine kinase
MQETGDVSRSANAYGELGLTLQARGNLAGAVQNLSRGIEIAVGEGLTPVANVLRQNLANVQIERGHYEEAYVVGRTLLDISRASNDIRIERGVLETLAAICDSTGRWKEAYGYLQQKRALDDTIASQTYQSTIAEAETKYETVSALRTRDSLAFQSRLTAAQRLEALHQRNVAIGTGIAIIGIIAVVTGILLRTRTIRARQQEERRATRALFDGEQAERIRIARDLHDSIGQMLAVTKMRLSTPPSPNIPEQQAFNNATAEIVDKTIAEVRAISHNLIPEDLTFGTVRALENLIRRMADGGSIAVSMNIADEVRAHKFNQQFSLSLYRVVQEVLSNMIKHSGASEIRLSMTQNDGNIILDLSDNGMGFDTSTIDASKGIGWKNVFARVKLLNGSVDLHSERISGTRIQISLPQ